MRYAVLLIITLYCVLLLSSSDNNKIIANPSNSTIVENLPVKDNTLTQVQINKLDSISIEFMFRGHCYAYSSNQNQMASNGEAHSDNLPNKVDGRFPNKGFYLVINEKDYVRFDSIFLGCKLYIVNTSNKAVSLQAQDSRLDIIAEAMDKEGNWKPISYLPSSWCGNSYHKVILDVDEYWEFPIPVFKGEFNTKLRYVLLLDNDKKIVSNVINAKINLKQFNKDSKQGHTPESIMDPYDE